MTASAATDTLLLPLRAFGASMPPPDEASTAVSSVEARVEMREHWVPVEGAQVRIRRRGSGLPVLFVHGSFVGGHLWDGVITELADDEGLELVVPDLPIGGHLRAAGPAADLSYAGLAAMLASIIDALQLPEVVIVANDSGGAITQHLLATEPHRCAGLLLLSTDAFDKVPPEYFRFILPPLQLPPFFWAAGKLVRTNFGRRLPITFGHLVKRPMSKSEAERVMGPLWSAKYARRDVRRAMKRLDPASTMQTVRAFDGVSAPVDIAWSADDRIFPPEHADRLAAAFPNGRRVDDITDSGSFAPLDQPGQVAERLRQLVERVNS
ncbi:MAG: alpha/beta fold hydrolase [Ilumatobacter sp.]|nr:alpha/beta fold hydrolase [Ilumatobacter sp.]